MSDPTANPAPGHLPGRPPGPDPDERAGLVAARLDAVRRLLHDAGTDAALLERRRDTAWLTVGGELFVVESSEVAAAPILVTADRATVLAPVNEAARLRAEELAGLGLELEEIPWWDEPAARPRLASMGARSVLEGPRLEEHLAPHRMRLSPPEHARLRWLAAVARLALDGATTAALPGNTEDDVTAAVAGPLAAAGARAPVLLAGADERLHYRHPLPRGVAIRERLMLVLVAERWGLHVAATRMIWPGAPGLGGDRGTGDHIHPADAQAAQVLAAMIETTRPGVTLGDLLRSTQRAYDAVGLPDEWRRHHQGGTIGYAPRERLATPDDGTILEEGMAVAWNPSVPGGKAEATLAVTATGAEVILD